MHAFTRLGGSNKVCAPVPLELAKTKNPVSGYLCLC